MPQLLPLRLLESVGLRTPAPAVVADDSTGGDAAGRRDAAPASAASSAGASSSAVPAPVPASSAASAPALAVPRGEEPSTDTGGPLDIDPALERTGPLSIIAPRRWM